ncbi:MAG TPA: hypothetical protein DCW57_13055 [Planctomycetaceae bacterium]|nr:hypothetical protein [Planctomycetaceae bacterium]
MLGYFFPGWLASHENQVFSFSVMCCVSSVGHQSPYQADSEKGLLFSIFHAATCVFAYEGFLSLRKWISREFG